MLVTLIPPGRGKRRMLVTLIPPGRGKRRMLVTLLTPLILRGTGGSGRKVVLFYYFTINDTL